MGLVGALTTAVGVLSWKVRQDGKQNGKEHLAPMLDRLSQNIEKQTEVMRDLAEATRIHNSESRGRHEILTTILAQLQRK